STRSKTKYLSSPPRVDFHATRATAIAKHCPALLARANLHRSLFDSYGPGARETRRSRQIDFQSGRETGRAQAGHVLSAQELGVWPDRRVESSSQSNPDRFCRQKSPPDATPIRRRESDRYSGGTFSCAQGRRPRRNQKAGQR